MTLQDSPFCASSPQGEGPYVNLLEPEFHNRNSHDIYQDGVDQDLSPGLGCQWMMGDACRWEIAAKVQQTPSQLQCPNLAGPLFMEQALQKQHTLLVPTHNLSALISTTHALDSSQLPAPASLPEAFSGHTPPHLCT